MQIMLHVPLVVHQVLYAYNKKKAGSIPKSVLNCWVNILFWLLVFFFFSFYLAFSSCGSLLYLLQEHCRQYWVPADCEDNIGRANNSCGPESPPSPWKLTQPCLLEPGWWRNISHKGSALFACWKPLPLLPSLPLPALAAGGIFTVAAKAGGSLWVAALQKQLSMVSWFSLVLSARSLGVCSFPNCCDVLTLKDLYLLCQSKTWRKIHFYSFYLGALSSFFFFSFVKALQ